MKPTDVSDFVNSLNAGVFAQQVGRALSDVAGSVIDTGQQGEVTLKFKISQIGESTQVKVQHTLEFVQPTKRGKKREDTKQDTPMYVTASGVVLFVENPTEQMFGQIKQPSQANA